LNERWANVLNRRDRADGRCAGEGLLATSVTSAIRASQGQAANLTEPNVPALGRQRGALGRRQVGPRNTFVMIRNRTKKRHLSEHQSGGYTQFFLRRSR